MFLLFFLFEITIRTITPALGFFYFYCTFFHLFAHGLFLVTDTIQILSLIQCNFLIFLLHFLYFFSPLTDRFICGCLVLTFRLAIHFEKNSTIFQNNNGRWNNLRFSKTTNQIYLNTVQ